MNECVGAALQRVSDVLEASRVPESQAASEQLLQAACGFEHRSDLYVQHNAPLTLGQAMQLDTWVTQRTRRYPLQYIIGTACFRDATLTVDERCLIPRPETEQVVDHALTKIRSMAVTQDSLRVLDVGTGSGNIAITLACEFPRARVIATDLSAPALHVARLNARHAGVEQHIQFVQSDCLAAVKQGQFHVIVSNPPYVSEQEALTFAPELYYEPRTALVAGPTGLEVIEQIIAEVSGHIHLSSPRRLVERRLAAWSSGAGRSVRRKRGSTSLDSRLCGNDSAWLQDNGSPLAPGGWLILEIGRAQSEPVRQELLQAGFHHIEVLTDHAGLDRIVCAQWLR